ncbi:MAG TPA: holo-ACP synthase [Verrucomicrobiae bacterium]|jgi:holo-[acyl-carrier protein] synthase|nr:holo-ACP synthase [Verrucomicrobiae bacterium]
MILGVGTDIVEVARIRNSYEKFGERFVSRILVQSEIDYCLSHKDPAPFIAARFAAKEAVSKAFGTGIGKHLGWRDIEVHREESGKPFVELTGKGADLLKQINGESLHLSISHTLEHATAFAVIES